MARQTFEEMDLVLHQKANIARPDVFVVSKKNLGTIDTLNAELREQIATKYEAELKTTEISQGSELEQKIQQTITEYLNERNVIFDPATLKAETIRNFMLTLSGYGILQPLMDDDGIEDIYIYGPDKIWYLKGGQKYRSDIKFESEEKLKAYIDNLFGRISRNVNNKTPIEDGRMPDGSRIAVSADVLSPNGYTMNIRKFRKERITLDKLVELKEFDEETKDLLIKVILSRCNFLVSGGTSSGKTTILNAMSQYVDETDNVATIEDNIELQLNREFWLQLEARKANIEGEGEITMEDLLVHLLRRSPDRIIVGEVRTGGVADTFLNAIQTGHDGTCATIHANNAERCRSRMTKLASVGSGQPFKAAQDDFDHSIDIIIQLKRSEILKRRVLESVDYVCDNGTFKNIVRYDYDKAEWIHSPLPEELEKRFKDYGLLK